MKVVIKDLEIDDPVDADVYIGILEFEGSEAEFELMVKNLGIKR